MAPRASVPMESDVGKNPANASALKDGNGKAKGEEGAAVIINPLSIFADYTPIFRDRNKILCGAQN